MNLDMTGYSRSCVGGKCRGGIFTDFTDATLNAFLRKLWTAYSDIDYVDSTCGYGCSDHASFHRVGFAASHPGEAPMGSNNPYIHTSQDTTDKMDFTHAMEVTRVALGYVVELGLVAEQQ